jgi:Stigma-specific protein, Stig1
MKENSRMRRHSLVVALAFVHLVGCGSSLSLGFDAGDDDTGKPLDELIVEKDVPVVKEDVPVTDMDAALDVGIPDDVPVIEDVTIAEAGSDAVSPEDVRPAADVADVVDVVAADVQVTCRRNADCASAMGLPVCDLVSGRCAQCVPTSDTCATGSYCDVSRRCIPGCRNGSDCVSSAAGMVCDVTTHQCVGCLADTNCGLGTLCTAGVCVPGCNAAHACATGQTCCTGSCVSTSTSATACGSCTHVCSTVHSTPMCTAGACVAQCATGWGDCDTNRDNGCETNIVGNPSNCGACGVRCSLANASATCASDRCAVVMCSAGYQDCDRNVMTGCEAALTTDLMNCGTCGNACLRGQSCNSGVCQCPTGQTICLGACTATLTDTLNCGTCGNACLAGQSCTAGVCRCPTGQTICLGTCTATLSDPLNCGTCNLACPSGQTCIAGTCSSLRLYHGWTCPIAGCLTTSYNTTAATNLGGRYPFNVGDSNACRAWKLAATVCTTQPADYSGNANFSCPNSGGFTDPVFGTYCAVANQYSCSGCPGACNAACAYNPLSLRNCSGSESSQP